MDLVRTRKKSSTIDEFESLLENHLDGLYRVALRYTRQPAAAEDLVHDTAVRALRFRDRFELGTNFKAWIYTVLTHTFIHRYRRAKREREVLEGAGREDVARQLRSETARAAAASPENTYLDHVLSDDVVAALDALPEDFRIVVSLCDLEGLTYKEIADAVGCPVGTVMSRLYRGRRLLERRLEALAVERGIVKREERELAVASLPNEVFDISMYRRRKNA
jgi:RNA polymerase sigma-70 factor (ECF subfamily)